MERVAVRSREIAIVGYESGTETLEIAFRSGGVYQYDAVPEDLYRDLLTSSSIGVFFTQRIKDNFPYVKIH